MSHARIFASCVAALGVALFLGIAALIMLFSLMVKESAYREYSPSHSVFDAF